MMRWIVASSLKFRLVVIAAAVLLIAFAAANLDDMRVDAVPEFSRPYVEIQTEALGLSAEETEALITTPLEADMLNGVSWVDEIRSTTLTGLSSIVLVFDKGTDIMRARQMTQERLLGAYALPNVSTPPTMINPISSVNRCMAIGLTSKEHSLIEMSVLARWTIKPRLMGVPGVANVSTWGQRERQLQVQVNPEKLRDEKVTLLQVIQSAGNALWSSPLTFLEASTPGTGGWIDTPNQRLGIQHRLPITRASELARVPLDGAPSKHLGDVATVVEDHQPLIGDAILDDAPALTMVIEKFPWANTEEVTEGVEEALAAMQPGLSGIHMDSTLFRPATFLELVVSNLALAMLISFVLMALALFVFLNWRIALISTVSVVVSLLAAGAVFYARGIAANMMIVGALVIALCVIIDDAIVDMENIVRRLRESSREHSRSAASIILEAVLEMRNPIFYATLILFMAVMPILFLEGVSGAFLQPVATTYMLAILASMVIAMTVTPALSLFLLAKTPLPESDSRAMGMLRRVHRGLFSWSARAPRLALITVCILLVIVVGSLLYLRGESLLPNFKETDLVVRLEGGSGTSLPAMSRVLTLAGRELQAIPGIGSVSAQLGRAVTSDRRIDVNSGELWVSIDPSADYDATVAAVRQVVAGYPGLSSEVLTYLQARIREELSGTGASLVVRVYGEDWDVIGSKAEEVRNIMAGIDGIVEATVQYPPKQPTVEIEVDIEKAKQYGLKPGDVRRAATSIASGIQVGNLYEEQKVFDVVVFGTPETRHSVTSIQNLLIDTPSGGHVRLQDVADVRIAPAVTVIHRDAVARRMDVTADVRGRNLAAVAADVTSGLGKVQFPLEYRAELLGEYADQLAAQQRILMLTIAAAVGIFLLLQAYFRSWRLAMAIFVTLPVAGLGGVLAAFLMSGGLLSLGSILGFLAIFGIAVRNAIMLIMRYRALERDNGGFATDLVKRGTEEWCAPVLLTAGTVALVFLPLALFGNIAGLEILHPMALIILGGLVTTTLYTLGAVPAVYSLFGRATEPALDLDEEMPAGLGRNVIGTSEVPGATS